MNEKAMLLNRRFTPEVNILALGSSMTQINLSSKAVVERFGDTAYFNFSGWGMDMKQANALARLMVPRMKPRLYLLSSNLMDFSVDPDRASIDPPKVAELALGGSPFLAYLGHAGPAYYLRQMETNRTRFTDPASYECLMYDSHGGVALNVPKERIEPGLWSKAPPTADKLDTARRLRSRTLQHLREQKVDLVSSWHPTALACTPRGPHHWCTPNAWPCLRATASLRRHRGPPLGRRPVLRRKH